MRLSPIGLRCVGIRQQFVFFFVVLMLAARVFRSVGFYLKQILGVLNSRQVDRPANGLFAPFALRQIYNNLVMRDFFEKPVLEPLSDSELLM